MPLLLINYGTENYTNLFVQKEDTYKLAKNKEDSWSALISAVQPRDAMPVINVSTIT